MEISLDAKNWAQEIDLREAASKFATAQTNRLNGLKADAGDPDDNYILRSAAILPKELLPVSSIGEKGKTLSFTDGTTYNYGVMPIYSGKATVHMLLPLFEVIVIFMCCLFLVALKMVRKFFM